MQFCNNDLNQNSGFLGHVQCISELCFKFHVPASNTFGCVMETRVVLQCDMVQNVYVIQGGVILQ